ncbi:8276_t:CDS:2 [Funneliformis geosporum]|uniref:8276_t:CDS:1 n=1 Tax=Funneliformis geosporum TaxID=1117311 RepID=A0A9W4SCQ7_9GLOM|nr:8276_t:CDS:2 [Funneliformis geosporum]
MLSLDKNSKNEGFKCFLKTASDHPISQFYLGRCYDKGFGTVQINKGLQFIHYQGIIHRDFHSKNILCENEYDVIISDLGISKLSTELSVNDNECYGIIPYIAPEIFQGQKYKKYTKASDIYSFGMIMWELMTGRSPFWHQNFDIDLIINICDEHKLYSSIIILPEFKGCLKSSSIIDEYIKDSCNENNNNGYISKTIWFDI